MWNYNQCYGMMKQWIKDGVIINDGTPIEFEGVTYYNPTESRYLSCGWVVYVAPEPSEEEKLRNAKDAKIADIEAYDSSDAVNSFSYGGKDFWFSKADRVGLQNSLAIEKAAGHTESRMWFGGVAYTLPIDAAIAMLSAVELYALNCYNVTEQHKADVEALATIAEVEAYDITSGYPDKLVF